MEYLNLFDIPSKSVLNCARDQAEMYGHPDIEPEHVLLALVLSEQTNAHRLLSQACGNLSALEVRLKGMLTQRSFGEEVGQRPGFSRRTMLLLTQAFQEMTRTKDGHVGTEHLLLAMGFERFGPLARLLEEFEITRDIFLMWMSGDESEDDSGEDSEEIVVVDEEPSFDEEDELLFSDGLFSYPFLIFVRMLCDYSIATSIQNQIAIHLLLKPSLLTPEDIVFSVIRAEIARKGSLIDKLGSIGLDVEWTYLRLKQAVQQNELRAHVEDLGTFSEDESGMGNDTVTHDYQESVAEVQDKSQEADSVSGTLLDIRWPVVEFMLEAAHIASGAGFASVLPQHIVSVFLQSSLNSAARIRRQFKLRKRDIEKLAAVSLDD